MKLDKKGRCGKRHSFLTRSEAKKKMKLINRNNPEGIQLTGIYLCDQCGTYHLTSQPKSRRENV